MALEPFFQTIAYILLTVTAAYTVMWAVSVAAVAYLLGRLRLSSWRWPLAAVKAVTLPLLTACAVWHRVFIGKYAVYAAYWALLFLLLGELHPVLYRGKERERLPWLLQAGAAALPIVSVLVTRDVVVLFLSSLCGGVILLRGKE